MSTSLSQFGITWTFDTDYTTGQYVNGDYYVVAPSGLTITGITPASTYTETAAPTVTISNASPAVITATAHGLPVNQALTFTTSGALPTGITAGTVYYIILAGYAANSFRISATPTSVVDGTYIYGSAVNTSSAGSGTHAAHYGRTINGSMVNPVSDDDLRVQGFDSAMYGLTFGPFWQPSLNVARPGMADLSVGNPLVVAAGSSLVSTISNSTANSRPQLTDAAILTVIASAPASGSFRPPPYGTNKTHSWNKSSLNYSILRSLATVTGTPSLATVEGYFARPWLEYSTTSFFQYINPSNNGPDYGREVSWKVGDAALSLHLNYSNSQKETLYVRLVQYGIDIYGAVAFSAGVFTSKAGILNGRKYPLLLAALALGDSNILAYADAAQHFVFSEDQQTFYVAASDVGRVMDNSDTDRPRYTYTTPDIGCPETGEQHTTQPSYDGRNWNPPYGPYMVYRDIIGSSYIGPGLAAMLLTGGVAAWNWAPFFGFCDRYAVNPINDLGSPVQTFHANMWTAYRTIAPYPASTQLWNYGPYLLHNAGNPSARGAAGLR